MKTAYNAKAALYDRYRWPYPPAAIRWAASAIGLDGTSVACDVGAGTGRLTEMFQPLCGKLYAVEPDHAMLAVLKRKGMAKVVPLEKKAHRLEAIPESSVDAILAGHALHWFDYPSTLRAFKRIAKDDGRLVSVNNAFLAQTEIDIEAGPVLERYGTRPGHPARGARAAEPYFDDASYQERSFDFVFENDFESYIGGLSSASYLPDPSCGEAYARMEEELRRIFMKHSDRGRVRFECRCTVGIGKLRR